MAMIRCPDCGERYSDTYRRCPFCEEDALLEEDEEETRRIPRVRRTASAARRQPNLVTPTLIVLIILMAALLVYLLWGDSLFKGKEKDKDGDTQEPPIASVEPNPGEKDPTAGEPGEPGDTTVGDPGDTAADPSTPGDTTSPADGQMPEGNDNPSTTPEPSGAMSYAAAAALPGGLSLNKSDFTRPVSEGPYKLKVSGGSGPFTWISEDPGIASVDASGTVVPIASGTTHILVTDGTRQASCIVRVRGGSSGSSSSSGGGSSSGSSSGTSGTSSSASLNRDDMTLSVGESFRLRVSGVSDVVWSIGNSSVATIGGDGTVTGVSKGMTTVTATWNGQSKECIVRVK